MKKQDTNVKGHGFFRKTSVGLASGIVLGATLLVGAGVASADEVTTPSNGNVASAQTNETKEVVVDNDLTKVVEEAKKTGLQVDKEPTKNIGTANTEAEAEALQKKAEAEVNAQKNTIQEAQKKFDEENKKVDENLSKLKQVLSNKAVYNDISSHLNYIQDEDYSKGNVKIGEISSSKGKVDFLNVNSEKLDIDLSKNNFDEDLKKLTLGSIDKPKEVTYSVTEKGRNIPILNKNSIITDKNNVKGIPVYLSPNETITYRVEFGDDSTLAKMGVKYKDVKLTLKSTASNDTKPHTVGMLSPYGSPMPSGGVFHFWEQRDGLNGKPFIVESSYNYLDKNGKVIDKKELGKNWFTKEVAKGSSVDETFFSDGVYRDEQRDRDNDVSTIEIGASDSAFLKVTRQYVPSTDDRVVKFQSSNNAFKPNVNPELYTKKQSEKVTYHLVSYNVNKPKATNNADTVKKGSIVQVFVDEGGKEIAPKTNTGEKPVDETVKLTHPNEITFEGKTYTFTKQDKVDPTKIPNGTETITYTYKLKEEPKPVPTPTPVEKPTTIHIDGNTGKEIAPKEDGTKPFKSIDGYEPAPKDSKNVENPKGETVRVYNIIKKGNVEVRYVKDDASKTVLQNPVADTVGAKVGSDYDTTDHKPTTITKDGVTYELVRTEGVEKGKVVEGKTVVTYVYREVQKPITIHVDKDGNPVAPKEDGTKPFKEIEGYKPAPSDSKNVEDPKGVTVRVYEKVKPEAPQEAPKTPEQPQKPQGQQPATQTVATKQLPNTGSEASTALAIAGLGVLGLGALAYKKKEN